MLKIEDVLRRVERSAEMLVATQKAHRQSSSKLLPEATSRQPRQRHHMLRGETKTPIIVLLGTRPEDDGPASYRSNPAARTLVLLREGQLFQKEAVQTPPE